MMMVMKDLLQKGAAVGRRGQRNKTVVMEVGVMTMAMMLVIMEVVIVVVMMAEQAAADWAAPGGGAVVVVVAVAAVGAVVQVTAAVVVRGRPERSRSLDETVDARAVLRGASDILGMHLQNA